MPEKKYNYVNNLWNDDEAAKLDPVGRLIYRSNILGSDQRITNTGGDGNTSSKISEPDPLTRESVEVMWVKGSGGDLRTLNAGEFFYPLSGQVDRPAKNIRRLSGKRAKEPGGR